MKRSVEFLATRFLLHGKTWRYLRYLHLREAISTIASEIETVCVCGAGHGMAELAIAAEFPHLKIHLTDIRDPKSGYPNYHRAMEVAWRRGVDNLGFSVWNVLEQTDRRFDLVCSTEMLEHIENDQLAATNMVAASNRYVYCLVPFADEKTNADLAERQLAWDLHQHYVCGYNALQLTHFYGSNCQISGVYWQDFGIQFRERMLNMSAAEIDLSLDSLILEAEADLHKQIPMLAKECKGIKILSEVK